MEEMKYIWTGVGKESIDRLSVFMEKRTRILAKQKRKRLKAV